jgi:hypothetical protein
LRLETCDIVRTVHIPKRGEHLTLSACRTQPRERLLENPRATPIDSVECSRARSRQAQQNVAAILCRDQHCIAFAQGGCGGAQILAAQYGAVRTDYKQPAARAKRVVVRVEESFTERCAGLRMQLDAEARAACYEEFVLRRRSAPERNGPDAGAAGRLQRMLRHAPMQYSGSVAAQGRNEPRLRRPRDRRAREHDYGRLSARHDNGLRDGRDPHPGSTPGAAATSAARCATPRLEPSAGPRS